MEWWLARGCDGFRMDVINLVSRPATLFINRFQKSPDCPTLPSSIQRKSSSCRTNTAQTGKREFGVQALTNSPRVHEYLQEMHREVLSKCKRSLTVADVKIPSASPLERLFVRSGDRADP
jgi:oligo-1,6-glucosidase